MDQYSEMQGGGRIMMPLCNRIVTTEVSNDYTLPDYQPEIRRILSIRENILPPAKYVNGDAVELDGNIDYTLIYVGADGEIYSAPLTAEYGLNIPFEPCRGFDRNEALTVLSSIEAENITARATAPRKLTVKGRLSCHVSIWGKAACGEEIVGEVTPESIQRLTSEGSYASLWNSSSELIELIDEYEAADDIRIVNADATVVIGDVSNQPNGISVKGDVVLELLCADEDGSFNTVVRRLPFSDTIESDREVDFADVRKVCGCVSSINIAMEDGKIVSTVGLVLNAVEGSNMPYSYTEDIYSTERDCLCNRESFVSPKIKKYISGNFSQSERISLADANLPEGAEIIDIFGRASVGGAEMNDGKCVLIGESKYNLICRNENEIFSSELRVPFKYEYDAISVANYRREDLDVVCSVISKRARVDGDNLALDAEIAFDGILFDSEESVRVTEVVMGEPIERKRSDIIVCYPAKGATVWSVAKKYLVSPSSVTGDPKTDRYCIIQM